MNKLMEAIGTLVTLAIFLIAVIALTAWSVTLLWSWYINPMFGIRVLTIYEAAGLALIFRALSGMKTVCKYSKEKPSLTTIVTSVLEHIAFTLFIIGLGWIYKLFL